MAEDLVLSTVQEPSDELGYLAGLAVGERMILAGGGTSHRAPTVLASSDGRHFEPRATPRELGLRGVLLDGEEAWLVGEFGQLARSRDHGGTWRSLETGTQDCLFGLARGAEGAIWVVGDKGFAARVVGERVERVDLGTTERLLGAVALGDELLVHGGDGWLRRVRPSTGAAAGVMRVATGAPRAVTGLAITAAGTWIVVGDDGFIGRAPAGGGFAPIASGTTTALAAVTTLADGRLVAVGAGGVVLSSTDDGQRWSRQLAPGGLGLSSLARFGDGALIGGAGGAVLRLAPPGHEPWAGRANVFGGPRSLDEAFAGGPDGFLGWGLGAYVAATEVDAPARLPELAPELATTGGWPGVAAPDELRGLRASLAGRDPFVGLRLVDRPPHHDDDDNVFAALVRRAQRAPLATDLVDAFCGVLGFAELGDGTSLHLELYAWDRRRQVLRFDRAAGAFRGVIADSLDGLVYLAALTRAGDEHRISRGAYQAGLRQLHGRVAPPAAFAIEARDPEFIALEPRRRDTEFFHVRARWIIALLRGEVRAAAAAFLPDLNQEVPAEQLPARLDACARFTSTALYAMWRAFLFDEPELPPYLEVGRGHATRLVRDAAALIDALRGGQAELGAIADVGAWLAAVRDLDLDPRRAVARAAEAARRVAAEATRRAELGAALTAAARPDHAGWAGLAWRWRDDALAHQVLIERLAATPDGGAELATLAEVAVLADGERALAIEQLAGAVSPVIEAVLVGALTRGELPARGRARGPGAPEVIGEAGEAGDAPGWQAIDAALAPLYRGETPRHYAAVAASPDASPRGAAPLPGISVFVRDAPPHFHFVTYGFTDLWRRRSTGVASGFGFELTFRLGRAPGDEAPPVWALELLQHLARYVYASGRPFAVGHTMALRRPLTLGGPAGVTAVCFADDAELGEIVSPLGAARFIQVVGVTEDEHRLTQDWSTAGVLGRLRAASPLLITTLGRPSLLADPVAAAEVAAQVAREGSSEELLFGREVGFARAGAQVRLRLGALDAAAVPRAIQGRLGHGRSYELVGRRHRVTLAPAERPLARLDGDELTLELSPPLADELARRLEAPLAGTYAFDAWPGLIVEITPSFLYDGDGVATEVRGVEDPRVAAALLDRENDRDDDDDDDDAWAVGGAADAVGDDPHASPAAAGRADVDAPPLAVDAEDDEDPEPPLAAPVVAAALAMTRRALALAPDDEDVQFTHAMLLLDGEATGDPEHGDALLAAQPRFAIGVQLNLAARMARGPHPRFLDVCDVLLTSTAAVGDGDGDGPGPFGDDADELLEELAAALLARAPERLGRLIPRLPAHVELLAAIGSRAARGGRIDDVIALATRLAAIAPPGVAAAGGDGGDGDLPKATDPTDGDGPLAPVGPDPVGAYVNAVEAAVGHARRLGAASAAVALIERALPLGARFPSLHHAAACAYVAAGRLDAALAQLRLACARGAEISDLEADPELGALHEDPAFAALCAAARARQEGN